MVRNPDRELREARAAYIGAARRLRNAFQAWDTCDIPLDPGTGPEPHPWTRDHIAALLDLRDALTETALARRSWDMMRGEWHPQH